MTTSCKSATPNDWLDTLEGPVQVVGNAPLAKPFKWRGGSVVRFNNFILNPQAGHVASHWVVSGYKDIRARPFQSAFMPLFPYSVANDFIFKKFAQRISVETEIIQVEDNEHVFDVFPDARQGFPYFPSTGFCFLAYMLKHAGTYDVWVSGFAGLQGGHYWNETDKMDHSLTGSAELAWIQDNFNIDT